MTTVSIDDIARWAGTHPMASDTRVLVAARGAALGPHEWLSVFAIVARYGRDDARFRDVLVGSVRMTDEAHERHALDALQAIARSVGATLEVRAPGSGAGLAGREWVKRAGPAPLAPWTVKWRGWWLDDEARERTREDTRRVEARSYDDALRGARSKRVASGIESTDVPVAGGVLVEVVELEETFEREHSSFGRSPLRHRIRTDTARGDAPTAMLDVLGLSPRDAVCTLADAWMVPPRTLLAAGAYLRGELSREEADATLRELAKTRETPRTLALQLEDALACGRFERGTETLARTNGIATLLAMRDVVPGLSLREAQHWLGELMRLADEGADVFCELGAPSRALARSRS
ncbi:MAG: hypothetical protein H6721_29060 [Sandaracinus sp.]|nr:hypothetical protein [Sandaracinus sp.]